MFVTMVIAALIINAIFGGLGLIPTGARPSRGDIFGSIHLDYKLALNILGVAISAILSEARRTPSAQSTAGTPSKPAPTISPTGHDAPRMLPERMHDDGLVLRRWLLTDAERLHAVIAESASELRLWLTWADDEDTSIMGRREFIAEREREWQRGGSVALGIFVGDRIAGGCSLDVRANTAEVMEIGYWLHPTFRGHGLATRAARLLTEAALAIPDVRAVEIRHDKANTASGAVPRRLGYTLVGEAPNRAPAPADSGTDLVWCRSPVPQSLVLRLSLDLIPADRGGRDRPVVDGYRASMSFGQRRRGVEPVVHDAIVVHEHGATLGPGPRGLARAWVLMPDELPRSVGVGSVFTLLEGDRIVGRAEVLAMCSDPTRRPLEDLRAAKTRRLVELPNASARSS